MSAVIQNRNLSFETERGADIYRGGEKIRINIPAGVAPVFNNADSYLSCNLTMECPEMYVIPDPKVGGNGIIEEIVIMDGTQQRVIETLQSLPLLEGLRTKYSRNVNDENLDALFNGFTPITGNLLYQQGSGLVPLNNNAGDATSLPAIANNQRGGGFKSQYYDIRSVDANGAEADPLANANQEAVSKARPVNIMYRFPFSGLLNALRNSLTNPIVLDGVVLEITLARPEKVLRPQLVRPTASSHVPLKPNNTYIGYGRDLAHRADAEMNRANISSARAVANFQTDGDYTYYVSEGFMAGGGAGIWTAGQGAGGATIRGIALKGISSTNMGAIDPAGGRGCPVDFPQNCSLSKIGAVVGCYTNGATSNGAQASALIGANTGLPVKVAAFKRLQVGATGVWRWGIEFDDDTVLGNNLEIDSQVIALMGGTDVGGRVIPLTAQYAVSDVKFIINVCDTAPNYISGMVKEAQSGRSNISIDSYRDVRVNLPKGSVVNDILIPCNLQRVYTILAVPELLQAESILTDNYLPPIDGLRDYQFIIDGKLTPNLRIDLSRVANGRVSALAMLEAEKALDQSTLQLRDMRDPSDYFMIGKRITADGAPVDINGKILKLRLNYDPANTVFPDQNIQFHFFVHYNAGIYFQGGQRVILE